MLLPTEILLLCSLWVCNVPGGVDVYDDGLLLTALADAVLEILTVFGVVAVQSEVESQIAASRFCIFREKFAERTLTDRVVWS